ncbi:MAG: hypothetical protein METHP_00033 [Methanoregula sp. SKADARSKE-2]|nr:MAG: hypothetical protein METHP_00033 [Methanoregula sp. SKADARSKE-2]
MPPVDGLDVPARNHRAYRIIFPLLLLSFFSPSHSFFWFPGTFMAIRSAQAVCLTTLRWRGSSFSSSSRFFCFFIPVNISLIGDRPGAGIRKSLFRYQVTLPGTSLFLARRDLTSVLTGLMGGRSGCSILTWVAGGTPEKLRSSLRSLPLPRRTRSYQNRLRPDHRSRDLSSLLLPWSSPGSRSLGPALRWVSPLSHHRMAQRPPGSRDRGRPGGLFSGPPFQATIYRSTIHH